MKIYVCIPSINEAKTIGSVTRLVDRGLQDISLRFKEPLDAKIINIDSSSEDDTVSVFKSIDTTYPKQSIVLEQPRGKGKNLLAFIKLAHQEKATACLTIDADIISANPSWINKLLNPILNNEADFITPLYSRSRFEGSSTNHFAYPIVLATTGINVRQPIAGDFAFNSLFLNIVQNLDVSESTNGYGVDIFLTLVALTNNLRHKQIELGEKIHNPSFDKLEYMFPQIAASAMSVLRNIMPRTTELSSNTEIINNISQVAPFSHKDSAMDMRRRSLIKLNYPDTDKWYWAPKDIIERLKKMEDANIRSKDWVNILSGWIEYGIKNKDVDVKILSEQLLPFFVLRATTFWFSSENMTAKETEGQIIDQALMLHYYLEKIGD